MQVDRPVLGVLRESLAVDRRGFVLLRGLRAASGVVIALAVGTAVGEPSAGVLATVGALTAGTVSLTQGARTPYGTMASAGAAIALSTFVGSLAAHTLAVELLALAVWGALAGLLAGASFSAGVVGVQAVVGLVVLGRYPLSFRSALAAAGEVLLGTLLQLVLSAVLRPATRDRVERRVLAQLADDLASWCADPGGSWTSPTAARLEEARVALDRRGDAASVPPLRSLQLGLQRSRLEVSVLVLLHQRSDDQTVTAALLAAAGEDLTRLALALRAGRPDEPGDRALAPLLDDAASHDDDLARHRAAALAGQLRGAQVSIEAWAGTPTAAAELLRSARSHRPGPLAGPLRHPSPAAARHALRLALVLPLAEALARSVHLERGYWVALTTVVVLKPDYATSVRRGLGRVVGTLLGVVPVSLLVGATHPHGAALVAVVGLLGWAAFASFQASFALYSGLLAGLVVVLLDVVTPGGAGVAADRAVDTLLGGGLALAAFLLLPAWEGPALREAVARLVETEAAYATRLLDAYGEDPPERTELSALARTVRLARAAVETSLARSAAEPGRTGGPRAAAEARDVLAGTARIAASLHVVHAHAVEGVGAPVPDEALQPFHDALDEALLLAAGQVRRPSAVDHVPDLRAAAQGLRAGDHAVLSREAEELVDATDTLMFATGLRADRHLV